MSGPRATRPVRTGGNDLPREKIGRLGAAGLANDELIALLLRTGYRGRNVFKMARELLADFALPKLSELSVAELRKIKGLGASKAGILAACFELGRRVTGEGLGVLPVLSRPQDAVAQCGDILERKKETLLGFYLNGRNQMILREVLSVGSLDASIVHPREVFQPAVAQHAAAVILAHNHPSGDCEPSAADIEVTRRLQQASQIMGIKLLDHIIVSKDRFVSLKERGVLS